MITWNWKAEISALRFYPIPERTRPPLFLCGADHLALSCTWLICNHVQSLCEWDKLALSWVTCSNTLVDVANLNSIEPSPISMMPPGLVNTMSKDDILDLLAYFISGGDPESSAFEN